MFQLYFHFAAFPLNFIKFRRDCKVLFSIALFFHIEFLQISTDNYEFFFNGSLTLYFLLASKFKDIYDEEYFVDTLKNDVRVVYKIPEYLMERFGSNFTNVYNFRVKAWSSIGYYRDVVLPKLLEEK